MLEGRDVRGGIRRGGTGYDGDLKKIGVRGCGCPS